MEIVQEEDQGDPGLARFKGLAQAFQKTGGRLEEAFAAHQGFVVRPAGEVRALGVEVRQ